MLIMQHVSVTEKDAYQMQKGCSYDEAVIRGAGEGLRGILASASSASKSLQ